MKKKINSFSINIIKVKNDDIEKMDIKRIKDEFIKEKDTNKITITQIESQEEALYSDGKFNLYIYSIIDNKDVNAPEPFYELTNKELLNNKKEKENDIKKSRKEVDYLSLTRTTRKIVASLIIVEKENEEVNDYYLIEFNGFSSNLIEMSDIDWIEKFLESFKINRLKKTTGIKFLSVEKEIVTYYNDNDGKVPLDYDSFLTTIEFATKISNKKTNIDISIGKINTTIYIKEGSTIEESIINWIKAVERKIKSNSNSSVIKLFFPLKERKRNEILEEIKIKNTEYSIDYQLFDENWKFTKKGNEITEAEIKKRIDEWSSIEGKDTLSFLKKRTVCKFNGEEEENRILAKFLTMYFYRNGGQENYIYTDGKLYEITKWAKVIEDWWSSFKIREDVFKIDNISMRQNLTNKQIKKNISKLIAIRKNNSNSSVNEKENFQDKIPKTDSVHEVEWLIKYLLTDEDENNIFSIEDRNIGTVKNQDGTKMMKYEFADAISWNEKNSIFSIYHAKKNSGSFSISHLVDQMIITIKNIEDKKRTSERWWIEKLEKAKIIEFKLIIFFETKNYNEPNLLVKMKFYVLEKAINSILISKKKEYRLKIIHKKIA